MNEISRAQLRWAAGGLLGLLAATAQAAPDMAGRWEGEARIPGGGLAIRN